LELDEKTDSKNDIFKILNEPQNKLF